MGGNKTLTGNMETPPPQWARAECFLRSGRARGAWSPQEGGTGAALQALSLCALQPLPQDLPGGRRLQPPLSMGCLKEALAGQGFFLRAHRTS